MGRVLRIAGGGFFGVALFGAGFAAWASAARDTALHQPIDAHRVDFPIPAPLTEAEVTELRAASPDAPPADLGAVALERAVARGKHLVESRYVCVECHGADFGGGVMVDDPAMGALRGPNLTTGKGSVTLDYTPADWDRAVRHGVRKDGTGAIMPADDFMAMSDRELADVISYLRTMPPVDREVTAVTPGPVLTVLMALGKLQPAAVDLITDHHAHHPVEPPAPAVNAEFGRSIGNVCTGCHNPALSGGPIVRGPPDWPAASNLTPAGPLAAWTFEDFSAFLDAGRRPDGGATQAPMEGVIKYTRNLNDVERRALWAFLRSVPPAPTPD